MSNMVDKGCKSVEWFTPPEVLEMVRRTFEGRIDLDPCTTSANPTNASTYFTKREDGLEKSWLGSSSVFVNPPYGKEMYDWIWTVVRWAYECPRMRIALLLAASSRWDQFGWQRIFSPNCTGMLMFRGRVKYIDESGERCKSPPYPSMMFFYNMPPSWLAESTADFGHFVATYLPDSRYFMPPRPSWTEGSVSISEEMGPS